MIPPGTRRLLNLLTVLSLLPCVTVCVLWVRGGSGFAGVIGQGMAEAVACDAAGRRLTVASSDGVLMVIGGHAAAGGPAA